MPCAEVRVLNEGVIGVPSDVVIPCGEVDIVHIEWLPVNIDCIGVVRAGVVLLTVPSGRGVKDPHAVNLTVVTA